MEKTLRTNKPDDAIAFVGNRTVYEARDIENWCRKETLIINFRVVLLSITPMKAGITPPQTIAGVERNTAVNIIEILENNSTAETSGYASEQK